MLKPWRFSTYVRPDGKAVVQADVDRLDTYGLEHIKAAVKYLAVTPKPDWNRPHAAKLSGHGDLYEIRFKSHRTEMRALGVFGPDSDEFVITILTSKKGNVYKPQDAFATARRRADEVLGSRGPRAPLTVDGEVVPAVLE